MKYVHGNLEYVTEYFKMNIPMLKIQPLEATYLAWINCRELGIDSEELEKVFLSNAKVALNQGDRFGPGGRGFVRMNLACPRSIVVQAVQQIKDTVLSILEASPK